MTENKTAAKAAEKNADKGNDQVTELKKQLTELKKTHKVLVDSIKEYDDKYFALKNLFQSAIEVLDLLDRRSRARGLEVTTLRVEYTDKRKEFDENLKKFESENKNAK